MEGLVNTSLGIEGEASINLGGDLAGDNLEDLLAEFNQEIVQGSIDLGVKALTGLLCFCVRDSIVDELSSFRLLGGRQDDGGVCGGILRLVLCNGGKIALESLLEWGFDGRLGQVIGGRGNWLGNNEQSRTRRWCRWP